MEMCIRWDYLVGVMLGFFRVTSSVIKALWNQAWPSKLCVSGKLAELCVALLSCGFPVRFKG